MNKIRIMFLFVMGSCLTLSAQSIKQAQIQQEKQHHEEIKIEKEKQKFQDVFAFVIHKHNEYYKQYLWENDGWYHNTYETVEDMADVEPCSEINMIFADLNGDRINEGIISLVCEICSAGGLCYVRNHIAVFIENKEPVFLPLVFDKMREKIIDIKNNIITTEEATFQINDANCCPSLTKTRVYKLKDNGLLEKISEKGEGESRYY